MLVLLITSQIDDQRKKALTALTESENIFRNLFEECSDPIFLLKDGRFVGCNNAALALFGYKTRDEVLNLHPASISPAVQPDGRRSAEKANEMIGLALNQGSNRFEWLHIRSDGSPIPVEVTLTPILIDGEILVHANIRDITERKAVEESLRYSELKLRTIYDSTNDAILLQDENGFFDCNQSALKLFGCTSPEELLGKHPAALSPPKQPDGMDSITLANEHIAQAEKTKSNSFEWHHRRCDNHTDFPAEVRLSTMLLGTRPVMQVVIRDISERKAAEEAIRQLAFYDHLTTLPNRRLLLDRVKLAMTQATRNKTLLAFLAIDLDRFKPVNDNHGHDVGDLLLQAVALRIQTCLRRSDTVSRVGGDEFVVLLPDLQSIEDGLITAQKIRQALNQPFTLEGGYVVSISSSAGVAFYPQHGETDAQLAKNADIAMYQAKALGRNTVEVYNHNRPDHTALAS
jgi:diguanylate cyclase (GGDEF)-like protein/PAS domain S-box-containing protein